MLLRWWTARRWQSRRLRSTTSQPLLGPRRCCSSPQLCQPLRVPRWLPEAPPGTDADRGGRRCRFSTVLHSPCWHEGITPCASAPPASRSPETAPPVRSLKAVVAMRLMALNVGLDRSSHCGSITVEFTAPFTWRRSRGPNSGLREGHFRSASTGTSFRATWRSSDPPSVRSDVGLPASFTTCLRRRRRRTLGPTGLRVGVRPSHRLGSGLARSGEEADTGRMNEGSAGSRLDGRRSDVPEVGVPLEASPPGA